MNLHPVIIGAIASGTFCALAVAVALIRRAIENRRARRRPLTLAYDLESQRWIPVGKDL